MNRGESTGSVHTWNSQLRRRTLCPEALHALADKRP